MKVPRSLRPACEAEAEVEAEAEAEAEAGVEPRLRLRLRRRPRPRLRPRPARPIPSAFQRPELHFLSFFPHVLFAVLQGLTPKMSRL